MSTDALNPRYALAEEVLSSVIHGVGVVLSIVALTVLVAFAAMHGDAWHVTSVAVFGTTLILLYTASTLYHGIPNAVAKPTLRTLDHIAIYLLIAGTYTPYTLISLRGPWGWTLFATVWGLALLGITLELTSLKRLRAPAVALYIGMGWLALAAAGPLIQAVPSGGLWLLFLGVYARRAVLPVAQPAVQPCDLARLRAARQRAALLLDPAVRAAGADLSGTNVF